MRLLKWMVLLLCPFVGTHGLTLKDSALIKHNEYRARHDTPPLVWSNALQASAQSWVDNCKFEHSSAAYGENLALGHPSIDAAIQAWYNELKNYNYASPGFSYNTGHFTQVIWKNSQRLGCALGNCPNMMNLWICQYDPPGNYRGQFQANVLPLARITDNNTPPPVNASITKSDAADVNNTIPTSDADPMPMITFVLVLLSIGAWFIVWDCFM